MAKSMLRIRGWIYVVFFGLILGGCVTTDSVVSGLITEGNGRHVPILIYDTYWNDPYQWSTRHRGDPLPGDFLYIEFVNANKQPISSIELYVQQCGTRGAVSLGGWLRFTGPFSPRRNYKIIPSYSSLSEGTGLHSFGGIGRPEHLIIKSVTVYDANGDIHKYYDNVSLLLSKNIANFCAAHVS